MRFGVIGLTGSGPQAPGWTLSGTLFLFGTPGLGRCGKGKRVKNEHTCHQRKWNLESLVLGQRRAAVSYMESE